ncbi:MAG: aspartate-semialdehyde dehydrogenase [Bacteroidota bacterium]
MKLAVIGATGLVGETLLAALAERRFPLETLLPVASAQSAGRSIHWGGQVHEVMSLDDALAAQPDLAIFATDKTVSETWVPQFVAIGTTVIDHSTTWRMHPDHHLIVPEVNGHLIGPADKIIANPNCSTIQLVMALAPLHKHYGLERLVVSTYQAVTGSGKQGVAQLMAERRGEAPQGQAYPHPIDLNAIPHIDAFLDNGYTKEEMKVVNETQKIFNDPTIRLSVTAVRIPVLGGHALAVNATLSRAFELDDVIQLLQEMPGVVVQDDPASCLYPMPRHAQHRDEVFVGRLRRDPSQANTLDLWIVADNLRKGAATNAVQIAEQVLQLT